MYTNLIVTSKTIIGKHVHSFLSDNDHIHQILPKMFSNILFNISDDIPRDNRGKGRDRGRARGRRNPATASRRGNLKYLL